MTQQLSLDLPAKPALAREDFFVSPSNALAVAMIDAWADWTGRRMILTGPAASGKTHLAHVWAASAGARVVRAMDLAQWDAPDLIDVPLAIEDVPALRGDLDAQTKLFHIYNLILAEGQSLLLTGEGEPAHWGLELPDLQSRMQSSQLAALQEPDDALLSVVMAKQFADRQLTPPADMIPYLIKHIDRSFEAVRQTVIDLDRFALAKGRALTRPLAVEFIDNRT